MMILYSRLLRKETFSKKKTLYSIPILKILVLAMIMRTNTYMNSILRNNVR